MNIIAYIFFIFRYLNYKNINIIDRHIINNTIINISFSICMLICIISVTKGFDNEIKEKLLRNTPHITINNFSEKNMESWSYILNKIKKKNYIKEIIPCVSSRGLILKDKAYNVYVNGMYYFKKDFFYDRANLIDGSIKELEKSKNNVAIGYNLANYLKLDINDILILIILPAESKKVREKINIKYYKVGAIFNINNFCNNTQIFLNIIIFFQ